MARPKNSVDSTLPARKTATMAVALLIKTRAMGELGTKVTNAEIEKKLEKMPGAKVINTSDSLFHSKPGTTFSSWLRDRPTTYEKLRKVVMLARLAGLIRPAGEDEPWLDALDPQPGVPQEWRIAAAQAKTIAASMTDLLVVARRLQRELNEATFVSVQQEPTLVDAWVEVNDPFDRHKPKRGPQPTIPELLPFSVDVLIEQMRLSTVCTNQQFLEPLPRLIHRYSEDSWGESVPLPEGETLAEFSAYFDALIAQIAKVK